MREPKQKLFLAYSERVGEVEGMFDENGTLLDFWACNDACWRNEYFAPFMQKMGIEVRTISAEDHPFVKKLEKIACATWGIDIEE